MNLSIMNDPENALGVDMRVSRRCATCNSLVALDEGVCRLYVSSGTLASKQIDFKSAIHLIMFFGSKSNFNNCCVALEIVQL